MEYRDKTLVCIDCSKDFVFTAGEQLFYAGKNFKNEPKRCKDCKSKRNTRMSPTSRDRVETTATCSQCGKDTTVPFKPTQGRPVYCKECFQQRKTANV
jgi:CxxC-x17-CxxC domain-containing protein